MGKWKLSIYLLTGLFISFASSCRLEDPSIGINIDEIITLNTDAEIALANGQTEILVSADLGDEVDANQSITFRTEEGLFSGAAGFPNSNSGQELTVKASGKLAEVYLVTNTTENASVTVSATVGEFTDFKNIAFERAYPDEMVIETSDASLNVAQGSSMNLTVKLFRSSGEVSDGTRIDFSISPVDTSTAVAEIIPFDFADTNSLIAELRNGSDQTGLIEVLVEVKDETGAVRVSQAKIIEIK